MATIGDQFADLATLFGGEGEAPSKSGERAPEPKGSAGRAGGAVIDAPGAAATGPDGLSPAYSSGVTEAAARTDASADMIVASTIAELTRVSAENVDLDATLQELDVTGLPLWALVAEVERFSGITIPDADVQVWKTPRDILRSLQISGA